MDRNRHLAKLKDKLPEEMPNRKIFFRSCNAGHGRLIGENWIDPGFPYCKAEKLTAERDRLREAAIMAHRVLLQMNDHEDYTIRTINDLAAAIAQDAIGKEGK